MLLPCAWSIRVKFGGEKFKKKEQQAYLRRVFSRETSHDAGRVKERQWKCLCFCAGETDWLHLFACSQDIAGDAEIWLDKIQERRTIKIIGIDQAWLWDCFQHRKYKDDVVSFFFILILLNLLFSYRILLGL